jgi:Putative DNA-binding domain
MSLLDTPINEIEEADIQRLLSVGIAETVHLDYKQATYGDSGSDRSEFLKDISAFANTLGGDIVIGVAETNGVPTELTPFMDDCDLEKRRLEQIALTGLEPRISNLRIHAVPIAAGGHIIIVRVPRSFIAPHRVIARGSNSFWARAGSTKYEPDVDQLRAMFTRAPQLAERMRDFRLNRIAHITAGDTPVRIRDEGRLVLHIVPFSAFDLRPTFSLQSALASENWQKFSYTQPICWRINFDGFLTLTDMFAGNTKHSNYVQVFRTGAIEAVTVPVVHAQDEINAQTLDAFIVKSARNIAVGLHKCGAEPPLAVMVSLIGVKGQTLVAGFQDRYQLYVPERVVIDRDQLHCAEVILEDVPSGYPDCAKKLRQTLDQLANAAGIQSSASFDQSGNFALGLGGYF